ERSIPVRDPSRVHTDDAHIDTHLERMFAERRWQKERDAVSELPSRLGRPVGHHRKLPQRNARPLFVPASDQGGKRGAGARANPGRPIETVAPELEPELVEARSAIREVMRDRQVLASTGHAK